MPLLQTTPTTRARSQIRPAMGSPVRHRLRVHVHEYELPLGVTRIGRSAACRIVIEDPSISRDHAEIVVDDGRVVVRDLGSRNGTWLDGERIGSEIAIELRDGARIRFGTVDVQIVACRPRAPMRSTLRLRACTECSATFPYEARACPSCRALARDEDWLLCDGMIRTPIDPAKRRSWWLDLHVDLVERALSLWRLDDAQRALQRIEDGLAENHDDLDLEAFDRACGVAVRLSVAQGHSAWIRWMLQTHLVLRRVPSRVVVDRLRTLPPILLEDVRDVLAATTRELARLGDGDGESNGDDDVGERLAVLRAVRLELELWRARAVEIAEKRSAAG